MKLIKITLLITLMSLLSYSLKAQVSVMSGSSGSLTLTTYFDSYFFIF